MRRVVLLERLIKQENLEIWFDGFEEELYWNML